MRNYFILPCMIVFSFSIGITHVLAQTVRVSADGTGDFTSIQAAVDFLELDKSLLPNVVMVAPGTYNNTSIKMSQEMSIIGEDPANRPVLVLIPVAGDAQNDAIVSTAGVSVTLENLICIPSLTTTPDRAVRLDPVTDNDVFTITINNVLISANDGSGKPLSVDGMEALFPGPDTSKSFNDDGIRILGGPFGGAGNADVTVNINHTVVTHIDTDRDPAIPTGGLDGFVLGGYRTTINFGPGVVASYCGRYGAQIITSEGIVVDFSPVFNCFGSPENPIIFKDNGSVGLQLWTGTQDLHYVQLIENPVGARIDMFSNLFDAENLLVINNEDGIAWLNYSPPAGTTFDFFNSTFFNNETDISFLTSLTPESTDEPGPLSMTFENTIFAGTFLFIFNTDLPVELADRVQNQFVIDYRNVALPSEGDFAVIPEFELFPVTVNLLNIVTADPEFLSTDPSSPDFLVVSNEAYRTAGVENSPLGGYFLMAGETDIPNWALY